MLFTTQHFLTGGSASSVSGLIPAISGTVTKLYTWLRLSIRSDSQEHNMINSVSNSSQVQQQRQVQQQHQVAQAKKAKSAEPKDSVVLSKQATGQVDADHDGDSK
jgi:hypothetical protein